MNPWVVSTELFVALHAVHTRGKTGYLAPMDVCITCSQQWPCSTMLLICPGCRMVWAHSYDPPKPIPTPEEVASWVNPRRAA